MAPAGLVLVVALIGAGPGNPPADLTVPDDRYGSRIAPILLLSRSDVQAELQLDARQIADARTAIARLIEQAMRLRGQKQGPAIAAQRQRIDEESINWLHNTLNRKQIDRLTQVNFQWEGPTAMTRPHVIEHLELTDQQRAAIDRILKQFDETRQRNRRGLTPAEVGRFSSQAFEVLSPSQKTSWSYLLGPPCHFTIGGRSYSAVSPIDPQGIKALAPSGN